MKEQKKNKQQSNYGGEKKGASGFGVAIVPESSSNTREVAE